MSEPKRCGVNPRSSILGLVVLVFAAGWAVSFACAGDDDREPDAELLKEARSLFQRLPQDMATAEFPGTPERVRLGRLLFFEPRVSSDGTVSCARCHLPALYATDGLPRSVGVHDRPLLRNAPTVLNAALDARQHSDGGFANVEAQAKQALLAPGFGNPDFPAAMARLKAIPGYAALFRDAFPGSADPVTEDHWGKAIGAYERTLVSPSRFDAYLDGKSDALSVAERQGLRTFIGTGCVDCHKGRGVGGIGFRKFGEVSDPKNETGLSHTDKGRFEATKDPADVGKFKITRLRNVAMTAPYFHDGSVDDLPRAVRIMAKVQLGTDLSDREAGEIATFLGSLTGSLPDGFERAPVLPPGAGFRPQSLASTAPLPH